MTGSKKKQIAYTHFLPPLPPASGVDHMCANVCSGLVVVVVIVAMGVCLAAVCVRCVPFFCFPCFAANREADDGRTGLYTGASSTRSSVSLQNPSNQSSSRGDSVLQVCRSLCSVAST